MTSIETLTTFVGWCAVINIGVLVVALLPLSVFHEGVGTLSARLFGVTPEEAKVTHFRVFQQYRLAIVVLNIAPYIALRLMA